MISVNESDLNTIREILKMYVPTCKAFIFGSRFNGTNKKFSDLDLAIILDKGLSIKLYGLLKEAFEESVLPFTVDIVDYSTVDESFKKIIDEGCERIY